MQQGPVEEAGPRPGSGHLDPEGGLPGKLLSPTRRRQAVGHVCQVLTVSDGRSEIRFFMSFYLSNTEVSRSIKSSSTVPISNDLISFPSRENGMAAGAIGFAVTPACLRTS